MTLQSGPRPVFIAALPREVASLIRQQGWRTDTSLKSRGIYLYEHQDAIIACAGMGAQRVSLAVGAAFALGPVSELISIGWAGACIYRLHVGDVVMPDVVVDAMTGERFLPNRNRAQNDGLEVLASVAAPAGIVEKSRLAESYYASAVDMEAATVARIARAREIPFQAIKVISDEVTFEMPDLSRFTTPNGYLREAAFGFHVALKPSLWKPVTTMAKGSKLAAARLQSAVKEHIQQRKKKP